MRIDPFVLAIAFSIMLAYFFPHLAAADSGIPMGTITSVGISLIFFFYGLKLSTEAIKTGLKNLKLHFVVQGSTFVLFPLIVLLFYPLFKDTANEILWLAFLFMAALPSTVSSSVVMVSLAKGNVAAAIFNASISGIIGILLTPIWMTPFIKHSEVSYDFTTIYIQLTTEIIIPLILGLSLRKYLGKIAQRNLKKLSLFDKFIILLIIYKSFVQSFEDRIFANVGFTDLLVMMLIVTLLFFLVYALTGWLANILRFNREDRITAQFCGTKKSLVHGTVFSKALFGQSSVIGLILLPLMLFHAIQILIISVLVTKMGKELTLDSHEEGE